MDFEGQQLVRKVKNNMAVERNRIGKNIIEK
jgi:hypothetical protein